jgi:hypothetical protein
MVKNAHPSGLRIILAKASCNLSNLSIHSGVVIVRPTIKWITVVAADQKKRFHNVESE